MSQRRYRIAMVAPGPFPMPRGSQVLVRELADALAAAGHTVHVVAYAGGDAQPVAPGVFVHRTPAGVRGHVARLSCRRVIVNLLLLRTLYRVVRRERVDVIHAHNYEAPLLAYAVRMLTGVPVVYHGHNVMADELQRYFRFRPARWLAGIAGSLLDRSIPRRADYVVALSERMARSLEANGVLRQQLAVIPPGIALDPEPAAENHTGPDPFPGAKVIAYAGNLDPYQDLPVLLHAMVDIRRAEPDARLIIATHSRAAWLQRAITKLELEGSVRVELVRGFSGVRDVLRRADLVVCPRASWSGFPIKLLNYMAAGCAMVVSEGAASAVQGAPMVVVPDGDASELARGIVATLRDPGVRARLGRGGRRLVADVYAWPRLVPRIVNVYETVLGAPALSPQTLQDCEKVLQKTKVWELMEGAADCTTVARAQV